jgi:hypothetical protein
VKRSGGIARRTPLAKARVKAKPPELEYASVREAVYARARGRCEVCSARITLESMHVHHRRARSAGHRDDGLANLLGLDAACHNDGTHSLHGSPLNAVAHGRIISRHDRRAPHQVPVSLSGGWVLLTDDGRSIPLPGWTPGP